jgi:hypothetical protein
VSEPSVYRSGPRKTREYIIDVLEAGLVPFVQSSPGLGKSAIMRSIANNYLLDLIDHRLSTSDPTDMSGLPDFTTNAAGIRKASYAPFDLFPLKGEKKPDGKNGWLVFFDEANSAQLEVQAAAYKVILDKQIGQYDLHEDVGIAMAGNLVTDRAIAIPLSTALQRRVVHIELTLNHREWMEDVALKDNWDHRVVSYLSYKPDDLFDFKPDHNDKTFCCPATWEFMNKLVKGKTFREISNADGSTSHEMDGKIGLYAGTITSGKAASFVQYCKIQDRVVSIKDVLENPDGAIIPPKTEECWFVVGHLLDHTNEKNFGDLCTYINRLSTDFKILFFRSAMIRHPQLRQHPKFASVMSELSRYLSD